MTRSPRTSRSGTPCPLRYTATHLPNPESQSSSLISEPSGRNQEMSGTPLDPRRRTGRPSKNLRRRNTGCPARRVDLWVVGRSLHAAVPRLVVGLAVAIVLAVGLVVFVVVGHQVAQGEPVVGGDEVDGGGRAAGVVLVEIGRPGQRACSTPPPRPRTSITPAASGRSSPRKLAGATKPSKLRSSDPPLATRLRCWVPSFWASFRRGDCCRI